MAEDELSPTPAAEAPQPEAAPPAERVETPAQDPPAEQGDAPLIDEPPDPEKVRADIEGLKKEREKILAEVVKARREKAEARAALAAAQQPQRDQQEAAPPPGVADKPKAEDFSDYSDYVEALADWKVNVKRAEWEAETRKRQQSSEQQQRMSELKKRLDTGFERYEDFGDVAFDETVPITSTVADLLADCEAPADVLYYLGKNRVEAAAISRMAPARAARELARIEYKLTAQQAQPSPPVVPPVRKISGAPPPIKPVGSSDSGLSKDPTKMSQREYEAWRESQGARRY